MRWLSWRHTVDSQYPFDPARLDMQHILVPRSQSAWQVGAGKVKGRAYMMRLGKTRQHAGCPFWFIWFLSMHSSFCRIYRDTVTMWRPCAGPWQWFPMFSSARSSNIARICQDWEFDVTFPCSHGIKCACHIPRMLLCHNFFGQYLSLVSWLRSNSALHMYQHVNIAWDHLCLVCPGNLTFTCFLLRSHADLFVICRSTLTTWAAFGTFISIQAKLSSWHSWGTGLSCILHAARLCT